MFAAPNRSPMVNANAPVNLVMEPNFAVHLVLIARHLDPVESQVRLRPAGVVGVFGVDLPERDERPAVEWPALQLGKLRNRSGMGKDRAAANEVRPHPPQDKRQGPVSPRLPKEVPRIGLELDEPPHLVEGI